MAQKQTIPDICYNITHILKGRFNSGMKQETNKQLIVENKTTAKEITKAFSAVTGKKFQRKRPV